MALLEKQVTRFADSLDDYEHVSVSAIGGEGPDCYWLVLRDHRFEFAYEISCSARASCTFPGETC